jgi:hypothetical protein
VSWRQQVVAGFCNGLGFTLAAVLATTVVELLRRKRGGA